MALKEASSNLVNLNSLKLFGTDSLCFEKDDFMQKDFNVDAFVQVHQASGKGGLDHLRDDLGVYLKILRSAMIDLINRDYADFVNLSTNLTGLDRLINALKTPLGQMREEVMAVEQLLTEAIENINCDLTRRHTVNRYKSLLHCMNQISSRLIHLEALLNSNDSSLSPREDGNDLVDRLASEVNHLNFLVSHCEGAALVEVFKPRVDSVCKFVESGLEKRLKEGIASKDRNLLSRTLRTYASLGAINHAHDQIRIVIANHLEEVVCEASLKSHPRGLKGIYENIMKTIKGVCDPLLAISMGSSPDVIPGYFFLELSAWPEVVLALETRTQSIFNSGNPNVFHQRFTQTQDFLCEFEKLLVSQERIEKFRSSADLQRFLDLWNLPVYFQIRYQEIGLVMESSLSGRSQGLSKAHQKCEFELTSSRIVWDSLQKCFDHEVFLLPLLHRFWKFSLLILSRHRKFVIDSASSLKVKLMSKMDGKGENRSDKDQTGDGQKEKALPSESIQSLLFLLNDIDTLASCIGKMFSSLILLRVSHLEKGKLTVMDETLEKQRSKHLSLKQELYSVLEIHFSSTLCSVLKQVTDTPRIYRRTNKPVPNTHQNYVYRSFLPFSYFVDFVKELSGELDMKDLTVNVFSNVSKEYYSLVYDVLTSVYKMEESLKRLKMAREKNYQSNQSQTNAISDDVKIRMQISKDVLYFGDQISQYGVEAECIEYYSKLQSIVLESVEGKFKP